MNAAKKILGVVVVATALVACSTSTSMATLLLNETFAHPDGNLVGNTPTPGPGDAWAAHSAAGSDPIQVTSGGAVVVQSSGSNEDVNSEFGGFALGAGQKLYGAFDVTVSADNPILDFGDYFAHFRDGGFTSRVFLMCQGGTVGSCTGVGDYTYGISGSSSGPNAEWATTFSFGSTQRIVHSYDFDTGLVELWVNPVNEASTSITDTGNTGETVDSYGLRQTNFFDPDPTTVIDNLCVGTSFDEAFQCIPEPSTLALFGLGALTLVRRRR